MRNHPVIWITAALVILLVGVALALIGGTIFAAHSVKIDPNIGKGITHVTQSTFGISTNSGNLVRHRLLQH